MENERQFFHGPVLDYKPAEEDIELIERLKSSDNELDNIYGEVYEAGCYISEFGEMPNGTYMSAVGGMNKLAILEFRNGREIDPQELDMITCMHLNAVPGSGDTREASIKDAFDKYVENSKIDPDSLDLFGSFTENGYKIEAYMPRSSKQETKWTIRVYKDGETEIFKEIELPMLYAPVYGVDVSDKAALEERVDQLMHELNG